LVGTQFSQPTSVRRDEEDRRMPLERPARPTAGGVTDAARGAILRRAHEDLGLNAARIASLHTEADHLADTRALFADVEHRYGLSAGTMHARVFQRMVATAGVGSSTRKRAIATIYEDEGAGFVLLALPATEFLTAMENAVALGHDKRVYGLFPNAGWLERDRRDEMAEKLVSYADEALAAHGAPYRRSDEEWLFEWIGDPDQHALTVQPALLALADARLQGGPRDDFERALRKRRAGTAKDLEDAILAAAKAVESTLKVLYAEHSVRKPAKHELAGLYNGLARPEVAVLPGYVQQLVTAVGEPRNHMAGHGPGSDVREVPEELADASIAAAATAITYLAHQLP
jgi:HEPN domain-containing protein